MEGWLVALIICLAYLAVTLVTGVISGFGVSKSVTGFVAADRAMNTVVLYFVMGASVFSSFAFLGGPGWAYSRGVAAFYILAYGIVGVVPLYFFGPRVRRLGERYGFVTQAEVLAYRFDSRALSVILALLSAGAFLPYIVIQMKGAGFIFETITDGRVPFALGAGLSYLVVVVYVVFSGVIGVGWTNMFQGIFMMIIAWFLGLYLPAKLYGGIGPMFEQIAASDKGQMLVAPGLDASGEPWTWAAFSSSILVSGLGFMMWPHLFMRSFAAKSDQSLRRTIVMYPTFQIFLIPILLIGFSGIIKYPGVTPADSIVPFLLRELSLSPVLVGLVCAGTLAASMSTGDAILHSASSIAVRDGLISGLGMRIDDGRQRFLIRAVVVGLGIAAFVLALVMEQGLVDLLLMAYGGIVQIFPLVFAAFYWPRATKTGALSGLTTGIVVNTLFRLYPELSPIPGMHEGVYGLTMNVMVLVVVSLLTAPDDQKRVEAYLEA
ncbi:MAG: pantothenate permease [Candidatus Marinimicrobia bacterium]|nr:pantothenate permease [Candidatus Neomarinimicrobiota bacterium]|tara:strand:+ start:9080 stop:10552 length:1473 start_codon:yes stop_codon:yes gene_type:complete